VRWYTVLKDRKLKLKVAVYEQPTTVRPTLKFIVMVLMYAVSVLCCIAPC
jgi:hypothetical protein